MSRKVQLRLLASSTMSEKQENDLIRFPRKARESFGFSNDLVVLGKGKYQLALQVKQAYKNDIQRLARMIQQGKLSDDEAMAIGYVTRSVQQRFTQREGTSVWISEGVESITIGADPEFGLIRNDGILARGNRVVPHVGQFGSDGPSVEVRPSPSNSHLEVVGNIEEILERAPLAVDEYRWKGGATFQDRNRVYWFGGHIHLGRPLQLDPQNAFPVYEKIASVLDGLLAFPMVRIDMPNPHLRRNGCPYNYGKAGDIRADCKEQDRFEYRVLSGLWLTHPTLARIVLGVSKAITETAYGRIADQNFDLEWAAAPASRKSLLKSFKLTKLQEIKAIINNAKAELITRDHIRAWEGWIRNLDRFDDYSEEINALIELVKVEPGKFNLDIRRNWLGDLRPLVSKPPAALKAALSAVEAK